MDIEEIWLSHSLRLENYIKKRVVDKYSAEDILQEVGLRLQKNSNKIQDIRNISAWLYRITNNLIVDSYRKRDYEKTEDIAEVALPITLEHDNYNMETAECLLKLVKYLPETDQEAIIASDYYGRKQIALSREWGLSYSGSKARVQRARKKLKSVLFNCCEVQSDNAGNIIKFYNKNISNEFSCLNC